MITRFQEDALTVVVLSNLESFPVERAHLALARRALDLPDLLARPRIAVRQGADWPTIRSGGVWPIDVIAQISPRPILIIHGELDEMAPLALAEQIYAAAGEPKQFWKVEGAGHRGLRAQAGEAYVNRVVDFYREYLPLRE